MHNMTHTTQIYYESHLTHIYPLTHQITHMTIPNYITRYPLTPIYHFIHVTIFQLYLTHNARTLTTTNTPVYSIPHDPVNNSLKWVTASETHMVWGQPIKLHHVTHFVSPAPLWRPITLRPRGYEPMKWVDDPDETNDKSVWSEMDSCVTQSTASADNIIEPLGEYYYY